MAQALLLEKETLSGEQIKEMIGRAKGKAAQGLAA